MVTGDYVEKRETVKEIEYFFDIKHKYNKKTKNMKIINSINLNNKDLMYEYILALGTIDSNFANIDRTIKSCVNEWIAHNRLYKLGLFRKACKDCDLTKGESRVRRICYWILSR